MKIIVEGESKPFISRINGLIGGILTQDERGTSSATISAYINEKGQIIISSDVFTEEQVKGILKL